MNKGLKLNGHTNTNLLPFIGFGNLVNEVFNNTLSPSFYEQADVQLPKVNVMENEDAFVIELMAVGFKKEDFTVDAKENKLVVKAEAVKDSEEKFIRKEFWSAAFERVFKLPKNVDQEAITAKYEAGILTLTLPKKAEEEAKVSSIKVD